MRFADIRTEWRVEQIESTISRKADSHEVSSLRSDVDRLERSNRELSSALDELRNQIQSCQDQLTQQPWLEGV